MKRALNPFPTRRWATRRWRAPDPLMAQHARTATFDPRLAIVALAVIGTLANTLLALLNAHGLSLGRSAVVASEALILAGAGLVLLRTGFTRDDMPPIVLLYVFATLTVLVSLLSGFPFPDPLRNAAIIALFTMLGLRSDVATVRRIFWILSLVVLAGLLLEIVSTSAYVWMFKPAAYYESTRGVETAVWDETGLFRNAVGFESRFSFGLIDHRSASVFLEQVSLANFAAVLSVFLLALWPRLNLRERILHTGLIVLILLTNSTRTSTALALVSVGGYFIYPHLPRRLTLALAPAAIVVALIVYLAFNRISDDLIGRVGITGQVLSTIDVGTLLGARAGRSNNLLDSGYGYIIASGSIIGAMALWICYSLVLPGRTVAQRRCAWGLAVYAFSNLMIGGTAIFSLKVSAILWLLVGCMIHDVEAEDRREAPRDGR